MWLYGPDSSTNQLAYNDDINGLWAELQGDSLPAGTYYVRVQTPSASEVIPGYTLFVDIDDATCADAYEPDDTPNTASEIAVGGMH